MLVRDLGDRFRLVHQPDHGELSGQLAVAWAPDRAISAEVRSALEIAAARHDDGWSVWERHPRLDAEGKPQVFFAVPRVSLLSSYRACVDVLNAEHPAAALFVSMHVSGLQRGRYGTMNEDQVSLEDLDPAIREFVVDEERRQEQLTAEVGVEDSQRWHAYGLLQVYDVLSLYLGMVDFERGESITIAGQELHLTPTGSWTFRCMPFPFATERAEFTMRYRLLHKREWPDEQSFREDLARTPVEQSAISIVPG